MYNFSLIIINPTDYLKWIVGDNNIIDDTVNPTKLRTSMGYGWHLISSHQPNNLKCFPDT